MADSFSELVAAYQGVVLAEGHEDTNRHHCEDVTICLISVRDRARSAPASHEIIPGAFLRVRNPMWHWPNSASVRSILMVQRRIRGSRK